METLREGVHSTLLRVMADNSTAETNTQDTFLQEAETYLAYKVAKYIDNYWFPVLIPLGLLGNTLSFLVMIKPNNRKVSTCIYMAAININDNAMMSWAFRSWYLYTFKSYYPEQCKLTVFVSLLILQNSTFQILAMTVDKYISIKWPHKAAIYSTPIRAKIIVLSIVAIVILYNLPHIFFTEVITGKCYAYSVKSVLTKVHSWSSFVINAVIPFLILLLTTYIRFIYAAFVSSDTPSKFATSMLIFEISYKLYVTNSGINFFLYCVSGKKFRNDLKEIVCIIEMSCRFSKDSPANTYSCNTISQ